MQVNFKDRSVYDKIFKLGKELYKKDEEVQECWDNLSQALENGTYDPMFPGKMYVFMKTIEAIDEEFAEHLSYYFYEALYMKSATCTKDGRDYNARDYEEYYQFYIA